MAKIPLRKYNQEIESLIDQSHFDQAIAHARHILEVFPKHLNTYRLLGKAYLESQRYGDAADIFQRVLSSLPDDFISHVGMSIIREDEGNLNDAIWHMERAFEMQPSNAAIQGEIRRLYGRRDGVEPPKVRLTNSALARMYIKGDLFLQAINELRTITNLEPERPDLLCLLAQAYFRNGQKVEAADTCGTLLKNIPFCFEANRILFLILSSSERASEAFQYQERLILLDPYFEYISPDQPSPELISDATVEVEKLTWSADKSITGSLSQPDWAASLGISIGENAQEKDKLPDWLANPTNEAIQDKESGREEIKTIFPEEIAAPSVDEKSPRESTEDSIPEWIKSAGWESSTGETNIPVTPESDDLTSQTGIEKSQIPDWLQAIAPETMVEEEAYESSPASSIDSDSIDFPSSSGLSVSDEEIRTSVIQPDSVTMETEPETVDEMHPHDDGLPEWLLGIEKDFEPLPTNITPDNDNLWTPVIENASEIEATEPAIEILGRDEPGKEAGTEIPAEEEDLPSEEEDAFAWLEGLAAKQDIADKRTPAPEDSEESPPEWILGAGEENAADIHPEWSPEYEISTAKPDETMEGSPELVEDLTGTSETQDQLREWLSGLEPVETAPVVESEYGIPDTEEPIATATDLPDWLQNLDHPVSDSIAFQDQISKTQDAFEELLEPSEIGIEKTEPISQDNLQVEPGEGMLFGPLAIASLTNEKSATPGYNEPPIIEGDTKPVHLRKPVEAQTEIQPEVEQPLSETEVESIIQHSKDIPDWLMGSIEEPVTLEEMVIDIDETVSQTEVNAAQISSPSSAEIEREPVVAEIETAPSEVSAEPILDDSTAFAWLESLAAGQGADEAQKLSPKEQLETPPPWVQEVLAEKEIVDVEIEGLGVPAAVEELKTTVPVAPVEHAVEEQVESVPELPEWLKPGEDEQPSEESADWLRDEEVVSEEAEAILTSDELPVEGVLDINSASLVELERLPGVGFIRAQAIIEYRRANGPFSKSDDLLNVPGIDEEILSQIKPIITFDYRDVAHPELGMQEDEQITLIQARNALIQGDIAHATLLYSEIVRSKMFLTDVIQDISDSVNRYPLEMQLWIVLGDAYVRFGDLQNALDAYSKAEDLLR